MLQRFILLRNSLNLSQKELAQKIGVSPTTICDIEKSRCPITERTIISICARFNVNENWLRTGERRNV